MIFNTVILRNHVFVLTFLVPPEAKPFGAKYHNSNKLPGRALAGRWREALCVAPAAAALFMGESGSKRQIWNRREVSLSALQRTEERRNGKSDSGAR